MDRASVSEAEGHWFESSSARHFKLAGSGTPALQDQRQRSLASAQRRQAARQDLTSLVSLVAGKRPSVAPGTPPTLSASAKGVVLRAGGSTCWRTEAARHRAA